MTRLTFVGDIALDKPLLKAGKTGGKDGFDFSGVFKTDAVFAESDLVVGNLETVFGGGGRFNKKPYHYNSPDVFCRAVKDAGIGLVSTATNHCMDEGVEGVKRTIAVLGDHGILHTGTFAEKTEDRFLIREINGIKIAFYSLTYSVNTVVESVACEDLYHYINLTGFSCRRGSKLQQRLWYDWKRRYREWSSKLRHRSTISAHTDVFKKEQINPVWMADIEDQLRRAKEQSDLLIVLLHSGGQFNVEPGEYSKFIMDRLCGLGADIVIGNHAHTVQRAENRDGKLVAYSLGGYCMSVSGEYLVHDCLPEYSLAIHVDIDEESKAFSWRADVLKGTEDSRQYLTVAPAPADDPGAAEIRKRAGL